MLIGIFVIIESHLKMAMACVLFFPEDLKFVLSRINKSVKANPDELNCTQVVWMCLQRFTSWVVVEVGVVTSPVVGVEGEDHLDHL